MMISLKKSKNLKKNAIQSAAVLVKDQGKETILTKRNLNKINNNLEKNMPNNTTNRSILTVIQIDPNKENIAHHKSLSKPKIIRKLMTILR